MFFSISVDLLENLRFRRTIARVTAAVRTDIPVDRRVIQVIVGGVVLVVAVKYYYRSAPVYPKMSQPISISNIVTPETFLKGVTAVSSGISVSYEFIQQHSVSIFTSATTFTA